MVVIYNWRLSQVGLNQSNHRQLGKMVEKLFLIEDYCPLPIDHQLPTLSNRLAPGLSGKTRLSYWHIARPLGLAFLWAGHFVQAILSKLDILSILDLQRFYILDRKSLMLPRIRVGSLFSIKYPDLIYLCILLLSKTA
tara:strand:- start:638 stop:1051 length:414 start_codon:yes stop_codon:yes gene_type:complete